MVCLPFGLSRQLSIGRADAQSYMDLYFKRYPGVQTFMHDIREKPKPKAMWKPYSAVVYICRISTPLTVCAVKLPNVSRSMHQCKGTAADIIKRAMIQLDQKLQNDLDIAMIMQVHDELVFEVRSEKSRFIASSSKHKWKVPLI